MRIGPYEVKAIETGRFALDGGAMFGVVPRVLWQRTNPADERNRIDLAARALLLKHDDGHHILVDNGIGHKSDDKFTDMYKVDFTKHTLEKSLAANGLACDDISDVILTHLHFDHAGGSTCRNADGKIEPTFRKATYHVQKHHFEWATHPIEKDQASFLQDDFMPLVEAGVLKLVEPDATWPGIRLFIADGHSPAQQLPVVSDEERTLFFCADLFPTRAHIRVPFVMAYDNQPVVTIDEKKRVLQDAFDHNWYLFLEHDPEVELVTIRRDEKGYRVDQTQYLDEIA